MNNYKILQFSSNQCSPCMMMKPVVSKLKEEGIPFSYHDANEPEQEDLVLKYKITSVPTFVKVVDDEEVSRFTGLTDINSFRAWILE